MMLAYLSGMDTRLAVNLLLLNFLLSVVGPQAAHLPTDPAPAPECDVKPEFCFTQGGDTAMYLLSIAFILLVLVLSLLYVFRSRHQATQR